MRLFKMYVFNEYLVAQVNVINKIRILYIHIYVYINIKI